MGHSRGVIRVACGKSCPLPNPPPLRRGGDCRCFAENLPPLRSGGGPGRGQSCAQRACWSRN
ncbi:hypothetical protein GBZ26_28765 [Azospirillum formosense]|uniref:Uncharacterized protein n=1 Tax=Azospirillum formosense TaxID=861533 RepID=A0ABX2L2J6_9PROT|nr:hypothetical protein [Azospirillum formosense]